MNQSHFKTTCLYVQRNQLQLIISSSFTGWVSITAGEGQDISLRAYTPGGHGCVLRTPALLPLAINSRGKRKKHSSAYDVRMPFVENYRHIKKVQL